jgi:HEAT repeat protein
MEMRLAPLLKAMPEAGRLETEAGLRLLDDRGIYEKGDLHRALHDETEASPVREVAAWVLGRAGDRRDSTTLARSLADLQPSAVRRAAVEALGLLPSPAASDALLARLDEDREHEVRAAAAAALGTLASRRGVDALCRRLRLQQLEADAAVVFDGATVADEARESIKQIKARTAR